MATRCRTHCADVRRSSCSPHAALGRRPRGRLVAAARVARLRFVAARRRGRVATALSVGRVDAMGHQGARLVRAGLSRALRARQRLVRRQRRRLLRRVARVSADDAAAAGLDAACALGPLGRRADELAMVADRRRAGARRVWRAALAWRCRARRARRRVPHCIAAARQRARRARRVCRPADGRVVHRGGARVPALDIEAATARDAALALLLAIACTQIKNPGLVLGGDPRPRPRRGAVAAVRRSRGRHRFRGGLPSARRSGAVQAERVQLPDQPQFRPRVGRPVQ